jgi:hypothetical protein
VNEHDRRDDLSPSKGSPDRPVNRPPDWFLRYILMTPHALAPAARTRALVWAVACAVAFPLAGCGGGDTTGAPIDAAKVKKADQDALKKGDDRPIKLRRGVRLGPEGK